MISCEVMQLLEASANFFTAVGVIFGLGGLIVAIRTYRAEREKERLEREYGTFDELDNKYIEFMYKSVQYPKLDLFSTPSDCNRQLSKEEKTIERAFFAILISMFERTVLMFQQRATPELKARQYQGWLDFMRSYCKRESFLEEWREIGNQFDSRFQHEMNKLIAAELGQRKAEAESVPPEWLPIDSIERK